MEPGQLGRKLLASCVMVFMLVSTGSAQSDLEEIEAASNEEAEEIEEEIEEVIVYGEKNMLVLRSVFRREKENFFEFYNSINLDDNFDVECDHELSFGRRTGRHICTPKFVMKAEAAATLEKLSSGGMFTETAASSNTIRVRKQEQLMRREIEALIEERPEFGAAYQNLIDAMNGYEAERVKRCGGRRANCWRL